MHAEIRAELISLLPRLRRFALGLSGKKEDADDLVQSACEHALSRLDQWQAGSRLDSWMFRIVQNCHIDRLRAGRLRGDPVDPDEHRHLADEKAHLQPEMRNTLTRVLEAVAMLPPEQRAVVMLVCIEEYSYREAAELLEVAIGTVMSRLARARAKLSEQLGDAV